MRIDPKDFALAVVSGNSSLGDSPEDISKNAIQLYLSALSEAEAFNKTEQPTAKITKKPPYL
jgi:hypothetical protein